MSLAKIYTEATKLTVDRGTSAVDPVEQMDQQMQIQLKENWKKSTITIEIANSVEEEIGKLIEQTVQLAINYPTHQNHLQIIANLVRVDQLKKQLETYGR